MCFELLHEALNTDSSLLATTAESESFHLTVAVGSDLEPAHPAQFLSASWVRPIRLPSDCCSTWDSWQPSPTFAATTSHPHWGSFQSANEHLFMWYWAICYIRFWKRFTKELIYAQCFDNELWWTKFQEQRDKMEVDGVWTSFQCWLHKAQPFSAILPLFLWFYKHLMKAFLLTRQIGLKYWTKMFYGALSYTALRL